MKDWLVNIIKNIPQSTKDRLFNSFMYTVGVIVVLALALALFAFSPATFFVVLIFSVIWAWIFFKIDDEGY